MIEFLTLAREIAYEAGLLAEQLLPAPKVLRHKQDGSFRSLGEKRPRLLARAYPICNYFLWGIIIPFCFHTYNALCDQRKTMGPINL